MMCMTFSSRVKLVKKIEYLGLTKVFKQYDSEKNKFLKYILRWPFLRSDEVLECFHSDLQFI